jgi:hypothetical protein
MKKSALFVMALLFLVGCATQKSMYYWGDYSSTLYKVKKLESKENVEAHKESLADIIRVSKERNLRVPPGIYAEYGYVLIKEGSAEGYKYLDLEAETYPESKAFIEKLKVNSTAERK